MTLGEQITAVQERAVQYHIQLSTTCLLQDSDGGDWQSNHAFHEVTFFFFFFFWGGGGGGGGGGEVASY